MKKKSNYQEFEINKAKICVYPMRSVKAAFIDVRFKAGSAYEPKNNWGAMHLMEHMLHQGTHKFETREDLENFEEEHGLTSNSSCGAFALTTWIKFPKSETNAAFELLDERIFFSTFNETQIPREVRVIEQEYKDKWSIPEKRFGQKIANFLYGEGHIATRDGVGQPDYFKKVTSSDLKLLNKEFLQPQNMRVSVAGNVNVEEVIEKLKGILGKQKNIGKPKSLPRKLFEFQKNTNHQLLHEEDIQNATVELAWFTNGYKELTFREKITLGIASYLLGSTKGLLNKKLRQEMGLVYKTWTQRFFSEYTGEFNAIAYTGVESIDKVIVESQKVIKEFISKPIPYNNFNRAKNFLNTQTLLSFDGVENISKRIGDNLFNDGRYIPPEEYINTAKTISESEIRKLLNKYLKVDPYLCVMAPKGTKI